MPSSLLLPLPSAAALRSPPMRSPHLFPSRRLPTSKIAILITGHRSKSHLCAGLRTSESKGMTELAGAEIIRRSDVTDEIDDEVAAEAEERILGSGAADLSRGFDWSDAESVLNKMSKWLVAGLFGLVILWKHDAEALWAAMGSVLNSWLSITLKRILNHQRPVPGLRPDPGMPSSHAQAIFYAATFTILSLVQWLGINLFTVTVGTVTFICASYLTWLRVSQKLHTASQVLVGALLGLTFCGSWFWMWHSFVLEAFISSIWVRIAVVLSSVSFCITFMVYVVQNWLRDEP